MRKMLLSALLSFPVIVSAETAEDWQFEVTPYLWASAMAGKTGPAGLEADVDMSFGDILDNLDKAFIINITAKKGQFSTWLDIVKMEISDGGKVAALAVDLEMGQIGAEIALAYQLSVHENVEVFSGIRYVDVDSKITFSGDGPIGIGKIVRIGDDWVDPFVGIRGTWPVSERWSFRARGDIGGFGVGSDFSWHGVLMANYQYSDMVSFKAGYRYLDMDYADNGFVYDMATSGVVMAVGFRF